MKTFVLTEPWTGYVHPSTVAANPEQPRQYFEEEALQRLATSMKKKQQVACNVVPFSDLKRPKVQWMLVDGERRWRASVQEKLPRLLIAFNPENAAPADIFADSFAANWCREGHTHAETATAIDRLYRGGRGLTYEEIADAVGKTHQWARNEHVLLKLHPDLLKLMDPPTPKNERLSSKVALLLIQLPPFQQLGAYEKAKHLKASEAFHKLRTSGSVRSMADRTPSDDRQYLLGKCEAAARAVQALVTVPLPMLKNQPPETLRAVERQLDQIETAVAQARSRVANAEQKSAA